MSEAPIARRPLLLASFAFTAGVLAGPSSAPWIDLAVTALCAGAVLGLARARRVLSVLLLPIPFFVAGTVAAALRAPPEETIRAQPERLSREGAVLEGIVAEAPEIGRDRRSIILDVTATATAPAVPLEPASGRVRIRIRGSGEASACGRAGDRVRVWGRLFEPQPELFPSQASAQAAAIRRNVALYGSVSGVSRCLVLVPHERSGARLAMERLRGAVHEGIDRALAPETAGVVRAFATGDRSAIDPDVDLDFRRSGLSHLLAVSGLNLAIVAGLFSLGLAAVLKRSERVALGFGARRAAALFAVPFVLLYTLLVGATPSAVRAAVMVLALLAGELSRRRGDPWNGLALALLVMLAWDPTSIADVSFQLSFAAVAALLRVYPKLRALAMPRLSSAPRPIRWAVDVALASAAATIGTAPLIARQFQELSPIGVLVNVPAAPLSSLVLVPLSLLGGLLGTFSDVLAFPVLWLAGQAAGLLLGLAHLSAALPGSSVRVPMPTLFECGLFYFAMLVLSSERPRRFAKKLALVCAAALIAIPAGTQLLRHTSDTLRISVLPVGQGDGIVAELPGGSVMLIDTGPRDPASDAGERVIAPYLRWRRISRIDLVVLTHPHADHTGGLGSLAEAMPIDEVWWTGDRREAPEEILAPLDRLPARTVTATAAVRVIGGVEIEILGPLGAAAAQKEVNDGSLVIALRYGAHRFLFSGDAELEAEQDLVARHGEKLRADVLKLGHHGSKSSSSEAFLDVVRPAHAVVSLGKDNRFGFPHRVVLERLAARKIPLWRTDRDGLITLESDGETLTVEPFVER